MSCSLDIVLVSPLNPEFFLEAEPRNAPNFTDVIRVFWQFPSLSKSSRPGSMIISCCSFRHVIK